MNNNDIIECAKSSQWIQLNQLLDSSPNDAQVQDNFGMLPLHWACTDRSVPVSLIKKLVYLCPHGVKTLNKGGLYPLHISIKAGLNYDVIKILADSYPNAVIHETPSGETPYDLLLHSSTQHGDEMSREDIIHLLHRHEYQLKGMQELNINSRSKKTVTLPTTLLLKEKTKTLPQWKREKSCYICNVKFRFLKLRHHCRNCGKSVCGPHSKSRAILPIYGLTKPQRICTTCATSELIEVAKISEDEMDADNSRLSKHIMLRDGGQTLKSLLSNATIIDNEEWLSMQAHVSALEQQVNYLIKSQRPQSTVGDNTFDSSSSGVCIRSTISNEEIQLSDNDSEEENPVVESLQSEEHSQKVIQQNTRRSSVLCK